MNRTYRRRPRHFQYRLSWSLEEGFENQVVQAWNGRTWQEGLSFFQDQAPLWSDNTLGALKKQKALLLRRLEGIDRSRRTIGASGFYRVEKRLWAEYLKVVAQEELNWFQKSRCKWLKWGDKNSAFFHASTVVKQKRQQILFLRDNDGRWIEDKEALKLMARDYYAALYSRDTEVTDPEGWHACFPELEQHELHSVARMVEKEEIKRVAFEMGALKAPGPDGI